MVSGVIQSYGHVPGLLHRPTYLALADRRAARAANVPALWERVQLITSSAPHHQRMPAVVMSRFI